MIAVFDFDAPARKPSSDQLLGVRGVGLGRHEHLGAEVAQLLDLVALHAWEDMNLPLYSGS